MAVQSKGMVYAVSGTLLVSLDAVFIRLSGLDGFSASFLFGVFSCISMGVFAGIQGRGIVAAIKNGEAVGSLLSGAIMGLSGTSFVVAIQNTTVANVVLIMSLSPFFSAFFSKVLLKEKTDRTTAIAMVASLVGMFVIVQGSLGGERFGDGVALVCSLSLALNYVVWRRLSNISRPLVISLGGFFIVLFSLPFLSPASYDRHSVLVMAVMGLLSAPIGRTLMAVSARYITAMEIGLISRVNVIVSPLIVWAMFSETPNRSTLIGGSIVLVTILLSAYLKIRQQES